MKVDGTYRYEAPPDHVYALLLEPDALRSCIPGCQRLDLVGPDRYEVTIKLGISAVRGTYRGEVQIVDGRPGTSYRMLVSGRGGPGSITGEADVTLRADRDATIVDVAGQAKLVGPAAGLAQRLLGGIATSQMNQFFECLRTRLGAAEPRGAGDVAGPPPSTPAATPGGSNGLG